MIVGTVTVLGLGAVFALNPADAKSRGQSASEVSRTDSGNETIQQMPPNPSRRLAPIGEHDFSSEWTDHGGWRGTWDDDFRDDDERRIGPPSGPPPILGDDPRPPQPIPTGGFSIPGGSDDEWFEYGDDSGREHGDDEDEYENENGDD